jgi:NADH-quinone oxidoreductase subunit C
MEPIVPHLPDSSAQPPGLAPAPATPYNPLAGLAVPFQAVDFATKGYHFAAQVKPEDVVLAAALLDQEGYAIDAVTGVDWIAEGQMEVVYDYFHPAMPWHAVVRCRIPRDNPELPTISDIFPGANWHEREAAEFFGIRFTGHPNLQRLLLPEDADYHPLRKDFALAPA